MKLFKDGECYNLVDDVQIAAFKAAGWTEGKADAQPKPARGRKAKPVDAEPVEDKPAEDE